MTDGMIGILLVAYPYILILMLKLERPQVMQPRSEAPNSISLHVPVLHITLSSRK